MKDIVSKIADKLTLLIIIIVGVALAFQIDSAINQQRNRIVEADYLKSIQKELVEDLQLAKEREGYSNKEVRQINELLRLLRSKNITKQDSIVMLLSHILDYETTTPVISLFEMIDRGGKAHLFKNIGLRKQLAYAYVCRTNVLTAQKDYNRYIDMELIPACDKMYDIVNVRIIDKDRFFGGLLENRLNVLQRLLLVKKFYYEKASAAFYESQQMLEKELR